MGLLSSSRIRRRWAGLASVGLVAWAGWFFLWRLPTADVETVWARPGSFSHVHAEAEGDLLVAVEADRLVRIDRESGATLWSVALPAEGRQFAFRALGPAILVSGLGAVHRFNPADGSVRWSTALPGVRFSGKLHLGPETDALAVVSQKFMWVLSLDDGRIRWGRAIGDALPHPSDGLIVLADRDGGVAALSAADGSLLWERKVALRDPRILDLPGPRIAVREAPDLLVALDADDGSEAWRRGGVSGREFVQGGLLSTWSAEGREALVEVETGRGVSLPLPEGSTCLVAETGERLFFSVVGGDPPKAFEMACQDRATGALLWRRPVPRIRLPGGGRNEGWILDAFATRAEETADGWSVRVEAGTGGGFGSYNRYHRLDGYARDGELLWTAPLPGRPILRKGALLLCLADGFDHRWDPSGLFLVRVRPLDVK